MLDPRAPRVSVILAAYNSDQTVAASLTALRAQTFRDFEIAKANPFSRPSADSPASHAVRARDTQPARRSQAPP